MMDKNFKIGLISFFTLIVFLILLVYVSGNSSKFRKSFQNEMAQRLDLEKKIIDMENDKQAMMSELDKFKSQLSSCKDEADKLKEEFSYEQKKREELEKLLEESKTGQKTAS